MTEDKPKKDKVYRPLNTHNLLQQIMFRYVLEGHAGSEEGKLAWVTSGFPVEIPVAMGITPTYPEQYNSSYTT